jgi:ankyrin repeat protein
LLTSASNAGLYWACVHGDLELVKLLLEHRGAKSDGSAADAADQQPIVDVNTTTEVRGIAPYKSGSSMHGLW